MSLEHYKYYPGTSVALAGGRALVCAPLMRETSMLSRQAVRAASYCTGFDTIEGHAARIASALSGEHSDPTRWTTLIDEAVRAGVLTSSARVRDIVASGFAQTSGDPAIQTIVIPTKDRPHILRRLLADLGQHLRAHERAAAILILDNSEAADFQQANSDVAIETRCATGLAITYVSRESRRAFATRLAQETGLPPRATQVALAGEGYPTSIGACRNAALLTLQGQVFLFIDDDVRCRLLRVPEASDRVMFDVHASGGRFFADRDELDRCERVDVDLLRIHERTLALARSEIEASLSCDVPATLSAIPLAFLQKLARGPLSVRVSCLGLAGDAASADPLHYYLHGAGTLSQLVQSPERYRAALTNRLLLRGPRGRLIAYAYDCMSYCMGVDHRTLMPPFMPAHSGEEQVFGALVARTPGAVLGVAPLAILHEPAEPRRFAEGAAEHRAGRFTVNDTLVAILRADTPRGADLPAVLQSTASRLREIAALPDGEFRECVRGVMVPHVMSAIQCLEQVLRDMPPGSTFWRTDVQRLEQRCVGALRHQDFTVPLDLEAIWGPDEAPRRLRQAIADLGLLVQSWTLMASGAARLAAAGHGLGVPACATVKSLEA
jgi:hypothetical protein